MPAIAVRELTRRFGTFTAVDRLSFDVEPGEIFGFLGANGAGKSTTIRMLCGLLRPTSGTALIDGIDVAREPEAVKRRIGYMSQRFSLYEQLTIDQNISFFGGIYGLRGRAFVERREFVLEMAGLKGRENTRTKDLAGGWRQRLALGCAILHQPGIVFLDEPTGGVDPLSRRQFWDLIGTLSKNGTTILVTTHYLDEAEHCHRLAIIHAGRLAALGSAATLKERFRARPIVEIHAPDPVATMDALDTLPLVEKTSLFGTAVHAVLRERTADVHAITAALADAGHHVRSASLVTPSLEDVFLDVVEGMTEVRPWKKTLAVAHKELRQIARDRRTLLILLFVPAVFLLLYGYALNFDIRDISLAVEDRDRSPQSRELVSAFVNSGYFDMAADITAADELDALFDRNEARAALVIPAGYARDVLRRRPVQVQIIVDGDNANTATTVIGYAQSIVAEVNVKNVGVELTPPLMMEPRVWYNPQLRSTLFLVPGLIAYIAMITAVISTALSVVREKERGTLEQVRMSPVSPVEYVLGKTIPYLALSFVSALLIVIAAMLLFEMPMRGSWLHLAGAVALFLVGAQAQGLVISTVSPTQQVAFQLALLSSFLPTFILSGFIFPISSMPPAVQIVTHIIPARYFIVALRGIVLKGADIAAFREDLLALAIFAVVMLTLASVRLSREWA